MKLSGSDTKDVESPCATMAGHEPMDTAAAAVFFAWVSRDLMRKPAEAATMQRIADRAVQIVPGSDHCGISLRRSRHRVESVAATSSLAEKCDALQYELDEGPTLEAVWEGDAHLTEDTCSETRWPLWSPRVAEHGIRSVLSIRLDTDTETLGALNLYAERPRAFGTDDLELALLYAVHAANALGAALLTQGLETAVQSRHRIGMAQGILMERCGLDMEQAFDVLIRYSSHHNVKLREVAEHVVRSGGLPEQARNHSRVSSPRA